MDTLAQRVALLREASGLDAAPLSRLCGLASSHLGMIERGDVTTLAEKTLRAIVDTTGTTLPWLAFGLGDAPSAAHVRAAVERARAVPPSPTHLRAPADPDPEVA